VHAWSRQVGSPVLVIDVGMAGELPATTGLVTAKVRPGTADLTAGPGMTERQAIEAIEIGITIAEQLIGDGYRCLVTGDMGIANTTASAALIAAFTSVEPGAATGRGTGGDDATYRRKIEGVRRALALHRPDPGDPIGVLAAMGGLEHAAIAGYLLGAAAARVPVVLDGVIAGAAARAPVGRARACDRAGLARPPAAGGAGAQTW